MSFQDFDSVVSKFSAEEKHNLILWHISVIGYKSLHENLAWPI